MAGSSEFAKNVITEHRRSRLCSHRDMRIDEAAKQVLVVRKKRVRGRCGLDSFIVMD